MPIAANTAARRWTATRTCACGHHARGIGPANPNRADAVMADVQRRADGSWCLRCACGHLVEARPVVAVLKPGHVCGAKCWQSKGHVCECSCGGANHGAGAPG